MSTRAPMTSPQRLTKDDPALAALNAMAEILDPLDRPAQLRILASACTHLGHTDEAIWFLEALKREKDGEA